MPQPEPPPVLPEGYILREVEDFDEATYRALVRRNLSRGSGMLHLRRAQPPERQARLAALREGLHGPRLELRVGIWRDEELVAWSYCRAESPHTLYMMSSGVEAAHRRRGLYTSLLRHVTSRARGLGFEHLKSSHSASNQPILIAKLREGWLVTGTRMHLGIGLLVLLEKPLYPLLEEVFHVRSGWRPPSSEILSLYGEE